jgi:hypothetical protein
MYVVYNTGEKELYDLRLDPYELQNRDNDPAYGFAKAILANGLHRLETCSGSSC